MNGEEIFYCDDLFLTVADIIENIKDEEDIVSERQTRASAAATECQNCLPNNYLLKESLETALTTCHKEFKAILTRLQQLMEDRLASIINDPLYKSEVSLKDFFSKCDQIRRKLQIWSHLLKKFFMGNFIFCAVTHCIKPYPKWLTLDLTNTSNSKIFLVMLNCYWSVFFSVNNNFNHREVKNEFEMI